MIDRYESERLRQRLRRVNASACVRDGRAEKGVEVMFTVETASPEETAALAERIGAICPAGAVFALAGDLGAGKTLFVQGLARGLGFLGEVTSPTFNLMNIYEGRLRLSHFDLYRLERAEELDGIGFYEYADDPGGVVVIEWFDKFVEEMPEDYVRVVIDRGSEAGEASTDDMEQRRLHFSLTGEALKGFFEEMKNVVDSGD